jgi:predicted HD superfamily hydrolase involved in NAD metabolism
LSSCLLFWLAIRHLDVEKAAAAGLMHDQAKNFTPQQLLEIAEVEGLELDGVDEANPHLVHPQLSAIVARDRFGVQDEEILQAIENHTLGRPGMIRISCIVFLADSIDPRREQTSELEARAAGESGKYCSISLGKWR